MTIDIFADVVCPWCYIGERRLHAALEQVKEREKGFEATVHWQPFQLQPQLPGEGLPWQEFAEAKFGSLGRAQAAYRQLESASRDDDIGFDFEAIASAPNTVDAHRLILYARRFGKEWEMAEALFAAYFAGGRNLNDDDQLVAIAEAVGLEREAVRAYLASEKGKKSVAVSQETAEQFGVSGVPFYIFDGRYAVSGAQPVDVFVEVIDKVLAEGVQAP